MNHAKLRLAVAAFLFVAWIGYLAYLVAVTRHPIVLSRPQFLVANLYIVGQLQGDEHPSAEVEVREVALAADEADDKLPGQKITVKNLEKCQDACGWTRPGEYILPLTKLGPGSFVLTVVPPSPGFDPSHRPLRIYPATAEARSQLRELSAAMK